MILICNACLESIENESLSRASGMWQDERMAGIPNVLAERYASAQMAELWSAKGRVKLERDLWIAVLEAQQSQGLEVPEGAIEAYKATRDVVDLEDIATRERVTRHDVKARIESYNAQAGFEQIHKGMTSRDLTENVEQLQVYRSLAIVRDKAIAALARLADRATEWKGIVLTARTHNVAAQPTTLGKRLAMFGEELLRGLEAIERLLADYPARGLKGAVGTQLDLLTLVGGDAQKVAALEADILRFLGLPRVWGAVGQVYPRSLDAEVVAALLQVTSGPASLATTLRLMAGHELASEGFAPGQTGSSAMPHKMNSRSCERLNGFHLILKGHQTMASGLAGTQWNEGDVACSVVRRVLLPDAFFATDGFFETFLTVLDQMEAYPAVITREQATYGPFLATTTLLMEAVKAGAGREEAHKAIKENALATVADLRAGRQTENDLAARLAEDGRLGLSREIIDSVIAQAGQLTGAAQVQVDVFAGRVADVKAAHPEAAAYLPGTIL